jgi:PKD repeat protein
MRTAIRVALVLALAVMPWRARPASAAGEPKLKKPRLELRATPRMAFSPVTVYLTAELTGGDDVEDFYCPELEWDWDDGGKSQHGSDCAPFKPGTTIERRFTAEHDYRRAGNYTVKVTMRRANRSFAAATVKVTVRPGLGDPTRERY